MRRFFYDQYGPLPWFVGIQMMLYTALLVESVRHLL